MCCFYNSLFPLSYELPKDKVDRNYVFIMYHSPNSICDRKVGGNEEPNGDELDLKHIPEGWKWVIAKLSDGWRYIV